MTMGLRRFFALAVIGAMLLGGCGDDDSDGAAGKSGEMGEMGGMTTTAQGPKAGRVVEVMMMPGNRFDPSTIAVKTGETITFKVVNHDKTFHEFMLGDQAAQAARDQEMMGMSSQPMDMDDQANSVTLAAGETKELSWTFKEAGTVIYGCHQPGNYAAGMKGTITVS
ncbi:MAG: plastocyanin/azurin family copper-binding protein [Actinomycetota bacterium]|nr:plastocyanin/azurin family copper-binding protein [Actinomycetota bacterium]